ncbi:hypothetical protein ES703_03773 [subsurface metagenome]
MAEFMVMGIIDGDTFVVSGWTWQEQKGDRVRPTGYDAPDIEPGKQAAKDKLSTLILGETVELGTAYRVDRGRLVCDVSFQGKNLADYFPEYKT